MIRRVYENALKCQYLDDVIVATDDERIFDEIQKIDGKVQMTSEHHTNGTERCLEIAKSNEHDFLINIQGDEPYIHPEQIDELAKSLSQKVEIATQGRWTENTEEINSESTAKIVLKRDKEALYFSRLPIPRVQNDLKRKALIHVGLYAYRKDILEQICILPKGKLEISESLEQLRWLENGYTITVQTTKFKSISVDTQSDLDLLLKTQDD